MVSARQIQVIHVVISPDEPADFRRGIDGLVRLCNDAPRAGPDFTATDCLVDPAQPDGSSRIHNGVDGVDGVMVPTIMEQGKRRRRETVGKKREVNDVSRQPYALPKLV